MIDASSLSLYTFIKSLTLHLRGQGVLHFQEQLVCIFNIYIAKQAFVNLIQEILAYKLKTSNSSAGF